MPSASEVVVTPVSSMSGQPSSITSAQRSSVSPPISVSTWISLVIAAPSVYCQG
jgi:hypothetical protein